MSNNNKLENSLASITYGLNPNNFKSPTTTTRKTRVNKHNNKTKKNESKSENTEQSNRYPDNILNRMLPYTLYYFYRTISFNLPLDQIGHIVSPQYFRILQFNGKNFFIFGEDHSLNYWLQQLYNYGYFTFDKNITIGFDGFVRSLISKYANFNFELYYEKLNSWNKREENNHKNNELIKKKFMVSMLNILDELFLNCVRMFNKSDCEYPNLRVHHADARLYSFPVNILNNIYGTELLPDQITKWDEILKKYAKTPIFLKLIEKQKQGISIDIITKLDHHFNNIFSTTSTSPLDLQYKFTAIMDYYTILRMLRNFDEIKTTYGRTKHWEQKNIIGYFGSVHSKNLCQLLLTLGAQVVYSYDNIYHPVINITKECIDKIDELVQQS